MAKDISNKTLATLLVVAIVVSIGGTYVVLHRTPGITGLFTADFANGTLSFTSQGTLSIRLNDSLTTFGNITNTGNGPCLVNTEGSTDNCTATQTNDVMVLENDGNVPAAVTVNSTKDKDGNFALGTGGSQKFRSVEKKTGSCAGTLQSTYVTLPGAGGTRASVCDILRHNDTEDSLTIHYQLIIGTDLQPGNQTENITFWASLA